MEHLESLYQGINTGQADPKLFDSVKVECYGGVYPLPHIAYITQMDGWDDPRRDSGRLGYYQWYLGAKLEIIPHDKGNLDAIRKALCKTALPVNPYVDKAKERIVVNVPQPYKEDKKKLTRHVKKLAEEQRVAVRLIRRKARKNEANDEQEVEKAVASAIARIDSLCNDKVKNLN